MTRHQGVLRAAVLAGAAVAASCLAVGPQEAERVHHYEIALPPATPAAAASGPGVVLRPFSQDSALDMDEIRYRTSDVETGYWGSHLWSRDVAGMVRECLQRDLEAWGGLGRVFLLDNAGEAELMLTAEIHRFEEVDAEAGWSGAVAMTFEATRASDGRVVYHRTFAESEPAAEKTVVEVVRALGRATGRIFAELRGDLARLPAGGAR